MSQQALRKYHKSFKAFDFKGKNYLKHPNSQKFVQNRNSDKSSGLSCKNPGLYNHT